MYRKRIELGELVKLGVSELGLWYYSNTKPLSVYRLTDGTFITSDNRICDDADELNEYLTACGQAVQEMEELNVVDEFEE